VEEHEVEKRSFQWLAQRGAVAIKKRLQKISIAKRPIFLYIVKAFDEKAFTILYEKN
jgi:hypothetical protein